MKGDMAGRFLIFAIIVMLLPAGAPGQTMPVSDADSLCIHFTGDSKELHIELRLDYSINGTLPLTVCGVETGVSYDLFTSGWGLENRRCKFKLNENGSLSTGGIRTGMFLRNAVIPGWGTIHSGGKATGWTDMLTIGAVLLKLNSEQSEYQHLSNRHEVLYEMMQTAGSWEESESIRLALHTASRDVNVQNSYRKRLLILSAALYGFQLVDPWLSSNPPRIAREAGGTIISVDAVPSSRVKAFLFSLVRPGRGQFYQGKSTRGILFSALTTAAALYSLDMQNDYDKDINAYEIEIEKYENAATLEEKYYHRDRAAGLWHNVEGSKDDRNIALILLAGLWGLNLADTFLPGEGYSSQSRVSLDLEPDGAAFVLKF